MSFHPSMRLPRGPSLLWVLACVSQFCAVAATSETTYLDNQEHMCVSDKRNYSAPRVLSSDHSPLISIWALSTQFIVSPKQERLEASLADRLIKHWLGHRHDSMVIDEVLYDTYNKISSRLVALMSIAGLICLSSLCLAVSFCFCLRPRPPNLAESVKPAEPTKPDEATKPSADASKDRDRKEKQPDSSKPTESARAEGGADLRRKGSTDTTNSKTRGSADTASLDRALNKKKASADTHSREKKTEKTAPAVVQKAKDDPKRKKKRKRTRLTLEDHLKTLPKKRAVMFGLLALAFVLFALSISMDALSIVELKSRSETTKIQHRIDQQIDIMENEVVHLNCLAKPTLKKEPLEPAITRVARPISSTVYDPLLAAFRTAQQQFSKLDANRTAVNNALIAFDQACENMKTIEVCGEEDAKCTEALELATGARVLREWQFEWNTDRGVIRTEVQEPLKMNLSDYDLYSQLSMEKSSAQEKIDVLVKAPLDPIPSKRSKLLRKLFLVAREFSVLKPVLKKKLESLLRVVHRSKFVLFVPLSVSSCGMALIVVACGLILTERCCKHAMCARSTTLCLSVTCLTFLILPASFALAFSFVSSASQFGCIHLQDYAATGKVVDNLFITNFESHLKSLNFGNTLTSCKKGDNYGMALKEVLDAFFLNDFKSLEPVLISAMTDQREEIKKKITKTHHEIIDLQIIHMNDELMKKWEAAEQKRPICSSMSDNHSQFKFSCVLRKAWAKKEKKKKDMLDKILRLKVFMNGLDSVDTAFDSLITSIGKAKESSKVFAAHLTTLRDKLRTYDVDKIFDDITKNVKSTLSKQIADIRATLVGATPKCHFAVAYDNAAGTLCPALTQPFAAIATDQFLSLIAWFLLGVVFWLLSRYYVLIHLRNEAEEKKEQIAQENAAQAENESQNVDVVLTPEEIAFAIALAGKPTNFSHRSRKDVKTALEIDLASRKASVKPSFKPSLSVDGATRGTVDWTGTVGGSTGGTRGDAGPPPV